MKQIDTRSGVPPWRQLLAALREEIEAGRLEGLLPSARTMAQETELAIGTVRKAYQALADEGLVEASQGWGTRVIPPEERAAVE